MLLQKLNKKGFTLVELMVVIVIIGILAMLLVGTLFDKESSTIPPPLNPQVKKEAPKTPDTNKPSEKGDMKKL